MLIKFSIEKVKNGWKANSISSEKDKKKFEWFEGLESLNCHSILEEFVFKNLNQVIKYLESKK